MRIAALIFQPRAQKLQQQLAIALMKAVVAETLDDSSTLGRRENGDQRAAFIRHEC